MSNGRATSVSISSLTSRVSRWDGAYFYERLLIGANFKEYESRHRIFFVAPRRGSGIESAFTTQLDSTVEHLSGRTTAATPDTADLNN